MEQGGTNIVKRALSMLDFASRASIERACLHMSPSHVSLCLHADAYFPMKSVPPLMQLRSDLSPSPSYPPLCRQPCLRRCRRCVLPHLCLLPGLRAYPPGQRRQVLQEGRRRAPVQWTGGRVPQDHGDRCVFVSGLWEGIDLGMGVRKGGWGWIGELREGGDGWSLKKMGIMLGSSRIQNRCLGGSVGGSMVSA